MAARACKAHNRWRHHCRSSSSVGPCPDSGCRRHSCVHLRCAFRVARSVSSRRCASSSAAIAVGRSFRVASGFAPTGSAKGSEAVGREPCGLLRGLVLRHAHQVLRHAPLGDVGHAVRVQPPFASVFRAVGRDSCPTAPPLATRRRRGSPDWYREGILPTAYFPIGSVIRIYGRHQPPRSKSAGAA